MTDYTNVHYYRDDDQRDPDAGDEPGAEFDSSLLPDIPEPQSIEAAICAIMAGLPYLQKKAAAGLNYKIVKVEDIIKRVRFLLVRYKVCVYPSGVDVVSTDGYTTGKGSSMQRTIASLRYTWSHAPSGTSIVTEVLGEAADSGDKSAIKTGTAGLKKALLQTLMIETGENDPDKVVSETLHAGRKTYAAAEGALRAAATPIERERLWARLLNREFSAEDIQGLAKVYAECVAADPARNPESSLSGTNRNGQADGPPRPSNSPQAGASRVPARRPPARPAPPPRQ